MGLLLFLFRKIFVVFQVFGKSFVINLILFLFSLCTRGIPGLCEEGNLKMSEVGYWSCHSTVRQGIRKLQARKPKGFKSIYNLVTVYPVFFLLCWAEYLTEESPTYLKII